MKKLSLFLVAILALSVAFGSMSAVAKPKKKVVKRVDTNVSINFNEAGPAPYYEESFFSGKAKAKKKKCQRNRKVSIKQVGGGTVNKGRTDAKGFYEIPGGENFDYTETNEYFAVAKKKQFQVKKKNKKVKVICKKGTSQVITVP